MNFARPDVSWSPPTALLLLVVVARPAAALQADDRPVVETARFALHDDPRVNLHHFLVNWAWAETGERPPWATPMPEREAGLAALTPVERDIWLAAVEAYSAAAGRSFVFDDGMVALRDVAAGIGSASEVPDADRPMLAALDAALPVYRAHWWPAHREANEAWIGNVAPTLRRVEDGIAGRLVAAYGGAWPVGRTRVDVVAYANAVDAYSAGGNVTIGSQEPGNAMPQAIEMVFHESSHVDPLESSLRDMVERAFEAAGQSDPGRFWHDVVFFTTGEATRLEMERIGRPGYEHYGASGLYSRNERWAPELAAFEAHWQPFLESESDDAADREAAMRRVALALVASSD